MGNLNRHFWDGLFERYGTETRSYLDWLVDQCLINNLPRHILSDRTWQTNDAISLGLFIQYTMQHEHKQDWFRTKNHGTVAEQISRWFEVEHRRNSEPEKKHSVYPAFL